MSGHHAPIWNALLASLLVVGIHPLWILLGLAAGRLRDSWRRGNR